MSRTGRKVYVGNLPPDVRTRDIEDLFYKFGKINDIDLKSGRGPPFAFIEFEDERDAEDAIRSREGYNYDGYNLRVEFPRGPRAGVRGGSFGASGGRYGGGGSRGNHSRGGGGGSGSGGAGGNSNRFGPPSRRSDFRVKITGLPPTGSWQDLKDHMREAGDVGYADVFKDGTGVVEFLRYEDMKYAIKKLDDSKFKSHEGDVSYIRIREEHAAGPGHSPSRSRSVSPADRGGRGSPTYSSMGSRSRSRSLRR